jgi:hypothetical protein
VNRSDFQALARIRLAEAESLLANGKFEGAYYLGGYCIECGLKACIAKRTKRYDYAPERKIIEQYDSHRLIELLRAGGLEDEQRLEADRDPDFEVHWSEVIKWSEKSRYGRPTEAEARDLLRAISDRSHGVLRWIKRHW